MSRYGRRAYDSDSDSDSDDASFGRSYYGQNSGFGFLPSTNSPYSNSYGSHFGAGDSDSSDDGSEFGARGRRKTTRKRKKPKATSDSESESDSDTDEGSSFGKKKKRKSGMSTKRRKMLKEVMRLHHKQGKSLKQAWKIVKKKKKYQ